MASVFNKLKKLSEEERGELKEKFADVSINNRPFVHVVFRLARPIVLLMRDVLCATFCWRCVCFGTRFMADMCALIGLEFVNFK